MPWTSQDLRRLIGEAVTSAGYVKRGTAWYLASPECVLVIALDKAWYGRQFFVTVGVSVRQLDPDPFPKVNHCHAYGPLAPLLPADDGMPDRFLRALDLPDDSDSDEQRRSILRRAITEHALPLLDSLRSIEGIRAAVESGRLGRGLPVRADLKRLLERSRPADR